MSEVRADPRAGLPRWSVQLCLAVCAALTLVSIALLYLNGPSIGQLTPGPFFGFAMGLGYAAVGAVISLNRPRHIMGWMFLVLALLASLSSLAQQYAVYSLVTARSAALPGARFAGWLQAWFQYLSFPAPIALPYLFFPDGKLPSPRWRPVFWLALFGWLSIPLGTLVDIEPIYGFIANPPIALGFQNPTGLDSLQHISGELYVLWTLSVVPLPLAVLAPVLRFRRAAGRERLQLKWFAYFGILILLLIPLAFLTGQLWGEITFGLIILALPAATAAAIVRGQLYEIDRLISRMLVYGTLTVSLGLVYLVSVLSFQVLVRRVSGSQTQIAIVLSTLLVAALFQPLRRQIQRRIDKHFYRQKYVTQEMLASFGLQVRQDVEFTAISQNLLGTVEACLRPSHIHLWVPLTGLEAAGRRTGGQNVNRG